MSWSLHARGVAMVAGAAIVWSTGGLIVRHVEADAWTIVFWRGLFASLTLLLYLGVRDGRNMFALFRGLGWGGLGVAVCFGTASLSFVIALQHTSVAIILFVQSAAPLVAGVLAWLWLGERMTLVKVAAMLMALVGVGIAVSDQGDASGDFIGIALSLVIMICFALATVLVRRFSHVRMTPATCLSAFWLVAVGGTLGAPGSVDGTELTLLFLFGACQLGIGFILFTTGARLIPAGEAILLSLLESILAPIWVWVWPTLHEYPGDRALIGGALVIAAVIWNTVAEMSEAKRIAPPVE
ncbi:MAG TPA: DMT family transporter [Dongiaceae bacterium]|nr:DMT family transporter [Dongiaceae bacterium]